MSFKILETFHHYDKMLPLWILKYNNITTIIVQNNVKQMLKNWMFQYFFTTLDGTYSITVILIPTTNRRNQ